MLESEIDLVPRGARKPRVELIIKTNFVVPPQRLFHCWDKDVPAVLHRQTPAYRDADDIAGESFDEFEHRLCS